MEDAFPFVRVKGSRYAMGRQHGEIAGERVRRFIDLLLNGAKVSLEEGGRRAMRFLPLFERFSPGLVEEVRGLADGAKVSFEEALLLQVRGEIAGVTPEGCTAFALSREVTRTGQVIAGQNSDMGREIEAVGIVLCVEPEDGPKALMYTFAGHLGYHGINSRGVGHFANALYGPAWRFALPHYPLKRRFLELSTADACVQTLMTTPVCSAGNYVLCDGEGRIRDVEVTPTGCDVVEAEDGFIVHANHFVSPKLKAQEKGGLADSCPRHDRLKALVAEARGRIDAETMMRFLSDHAGHPTSICRHGGPGEMKTAASLVAEPERGVLHVCKGNPCEGTYKAYAM
ncbi:MAG: hypothetical protein EXS64_08860 [Candidatus Latescibacteria bacterium]|nr:hypothetical protein [Candidatus Latescibacterota bacterium]